METTLYVDLLSQPSRAVCLLNRCASLGAVEHSLRLRAGDQRTDAYKALSPLAKVPLLVERATGSAAAVSFLGRSSDAAVYALPESCAILRYLCNSRRSVAEHWYPVAPRQRAAVDAALDWHHATLRRGAATLVFERLFKGNDAAAEADAGVRDALALLQAALRQLSSVWLAGPEPFLCGEQVSIADLVLACEMAQLRLLACSAAPPGQAQLLAPHPRVVAWMAAVERATGPHWAAVNAKIDGLAAAGTGARAKL